ncbi:pentapeptide repeat-containing protein [Cylindrospermum sp. NIES-4074]|nr:pentapeptide repeat-containing protein [Cylindrospermum sp. NIES-4074]
MNNQPGIIIKKKVSVLNKKLDINIGSFFTALSKTVVNAVVNREGVPENIVEVAAAVGLATEPEEIAWDLIYNSLTQAIYSLVKDRQDLLKNAENKDIEIIVTYRLEQCLEKLEQAELTINNNFFKYPKSLSIIDEVKIPFYQWLEAFGVIPAEAKLISNQLADEFALSLYKEFAKNRHKYQSLLDNLDNPFNEAIERQLEWQIYSQWLQKQVVNERMFDEAFGLKEVYVNLRGYYKRKIKGEKNKDFTRRGREEEKFDQVVVDLETELDAWLNKAESKDAIRVISGGPGSGKSSFSKIFAANQAQKGEVRVLFIPLHRFAVTDNLISAVGEFVKTNDFLNHNPLESKNLESRLLIIFDGLDELAMQGKIGAEIAQQFILKIESSLGNFNHQKTRLQILITGRDLVVQANSGQFDKTEQQLLYVLPYFVYESQREYYIDENKYLEQDQRQIWWQNFGNAKGIEYLGLPPELDRGKLIDITAQPLLNYLVALSFARGEIDFTENSNLNTIYADLLKAVYERRWGDKKHPIVKEFGIEDEEDFVLVLEEIALTCWHGDGRTTTVSKIEKICAVNDRFKRLFEEYQQATESGVTRLLTAFYFRQSGVKEQEKTFEFTHKTFREYLTARRIVRELQFIHEQLEERQKDKYGRKGWGEIEALEKWAILCGTSAMDEYLFEFVFDEIRLQNPSDVTKWQEMLCHLISFMLRYGMPMEKLNLPNFHEQNRQARNAEEALLVVLNACARVTQNISKIQWHSSFMEIYDEEETEYFTDFGVWISRLRGQRLDFYNNVFCLNYLSFLDLQYCMLIFQDFYGANLKEANLERAVLYGTNLEQSNLYKTNFYGANLYRTNLEMSNIHKTNFYGANLKEANLDRANVNVVIFEEANIEDASFYMANINETNFNFVILLGAIFYGANIQNSSFEDTICGDANFKNANIKDVNFEGANLEGVNFDGANLVGANLRGTILEGKDLTYLSDDSDAE